MELPATLSFLWFYLHDKNATELVPMIFLGVWLVHSDAIIRNLRSKSEVESGERIYRIPPGGLFRYVTNPSYFTELVSFAGFAIATWSPGAPLCIVGQWITGGGYSSIDSGTSSALSPSLTGCPTISS